MKDNVGFILALCGIVLVLLARSTLTRVLSIVLIVIAALVMR